MEHAAFIQQTFLQSSLECTIHGFFGHDIDQWRIVGNLFSKFDGLVDELIGREDLEEAITLNLLEIYLRDQSTFQCLLGLNSVTSQTHFHSQ